MILYRYQWCARCDCEVEWFEDGPTGNLYCEKCWEVLGEWSEEAQWYMAPDQLVGRWPTNWRSADASVRFPAAIPPAIRADFDVEPVGPVRTHTV